MSARDDGGPAFPALEEHGLNNGCYGLTMRDYFAAKAMAALICMPCNNDGEYHEDAVADTAYKMADQMLMERAK